MVTVVLSNLRSNCKQPTCPWNWTDVVEWGLSTHDPPQRMKGQNQIDLRVWTTEISQNHE